MGVDEQVLHELQTGWEQRLLNSGIFSSGVIDYRAPGSIAGVMGINQLPNSLGFYPPIGVCYSNPQYQIPNAVNPMNPPTATEINPPISSSVNLANPTHKGGGAPSSNPAPLVDPTADQSPKTEKKKVSSC